jgi:predicted glutamine amidotransferase
MCRMFAALASGPVPYDLFEEFADLAETGMCPEGGADARGHKDGWGLVAFHNGALVVEARGLGNVKEAPLYYKHAWKIARINAERAGGSLLAVLAHVRRAGPGGVLGEAFTHPLLARHGDRTLAFAHNGTLRGFDQRKEGRLDTAAYLDAVRERWAAGPGPAFAHAREAIHRLYSPSSLSAILTDGQSLHALRDPYTAPEYYTLYHDHWGEAVVVCSEPILSMRPNLLAPGRLLSVSPGLDVEETPLRDQGSVRETPASRISAAKPE